jgi:hypothetical protein
MSGSRARWLVLAAALLPLLAVVPARADETGPAAAATYSSRLGTVVGATRPEGRLHVGAALGQETDRTYLRFDAPAPFTVAIELDADGTTAPETAAVLACAVPAGFDPGAADPAEVDCDDAPTATVADGVLSFEVARDGDIALVPTGDGTWHLAFAADAPTATFEPAPPATTTTTSQVAASPPPSFVTPSGPLGVALPDLSPPPVAAGQAIADQAQVTTPPTPGVVGVPAGSSGFRYGAVFALPLVLLVVVGLAGDGLTRPVRLREEAS